MPDTDTLNPVEINEDAEDEVQNKIEKPYGVLELVSFGSKTLLAGFSFYQRTYKSLALAVEHVNSLGKNGEEVVLALVNTALSAASRTKATASAPTDAEGDKEKTKQLRAAALEKGENILISEEEAEKYIPGTRERYALGYFQREYLKARKAFTENKTPENLEAFKKARQELRDAEDRDAMETLGELSPEVVNAVLPTA
jgi:hypothetical protein